MHRLCWGPLLVKAVCSVESLTSRCQMDNQSIANINSPVLVGATEDLYQVSWLRLNSRLEIFFFCREKGFWKKILIFGIKKYMFPVVMNRVMSTMKDVYQLSRLWVHLMVIKQI